MNVIERDLTSIRPYENNPRDNEAAVAFVANSIREFGWKQPIVIDKDGVIIAGHTRYKAAQTLGLKSAPCVIADDLTEEQVKAYRLADNKVGEIATWDFDALEEELDAIEDIDMSDFVLDLFGGSGTTLIAAEETGRACRMMELDPKYVDVIINRWEQATGKKAVRISE